jgi:hypothetical protein
MDPNEIIKAAPEIAKGAAALGAAIPFTGIVKRMLGPAADEVAEIWRDQVRVYRYGRQLKLLEKAEKMAQDAGFTPQAVPPKILFPLLEGASFEEDENLHDMWAALLANAASPENAENVRPGFIVTLRQMAPDEAAVLNWIFDRVNPEGSENLSLDELFRDLATLSADMSRLRICLEGLESAGLISRLDTERKRMFVFDSESGESNFTSGFPLKITLRGVEFVLACRPPKRKE